MRGPEHFDGIAAGYEEQIPAHVRERLLARKIAFMRRRVEEARVPAGGRRLDAGCGQGWYACELATLPDPRYEVDAVDSPPTRSRTRGQYAASRGCPVRFQATDSERLPSRTRVRLRIQHQRDAQRDRRRQAGARARRDRARAQAGGVFFLHEINTQNPQGSDHTAGLRERAMDG